VTVKTGKLVSFQNAKAASGTVRSINRMKQETAGLTKNNLISQEKVDTEDIVKILDEHSGDRGGLIRILEEIQAKYGFLPEKALRTVSCRMNRPLVDVYSVATFYRSFSLKPRGKHLVCACLGTACHVRGAQRVVEEFERQLGVKARQTTPDNEFTFDTVNCLGACALGPVVVIDGCYFPKVRKSRIRELLDKALKGFDRIDIQNDRQIFPVNVNCPRCNHSLRDETFAIDGYPSLKLLISFDHKKGWLRMSSLYGSYNVAAEFDIPTGTVVAFACPHCHSKLQSTNDCSFCGAPMVPMLVDGGGIVTICTRRGCKNHSLDLT